LSISLLFKGIRQINPKIVWPFKRKYGSKDSTHSVFSSRHEYNITNREEANISETEDEASFHAISQLEDMGEELFLAMVAETAVDSGGAPVVTTEA